jgi:hypothetical protein
LERSGCASSAGALNKVNIDLVLLAQLFNVRTHCVDTDLAKRGCAWSSLGHFSFLVCAVKNPAF